MTTNAIIISCLAFLAGLEVAYLSLKRKSKKASLEQQEALIEAKAKMQSKQELLDTKDRQLRQKEEQLQENQKRIEQLALEKATLDANFKNLQQKLEEQKTDLVNMQEKFQHEFENLAEKIFEEKSKKFTEQNKNNLGDVLNPLRERILEFQKKVEDSNTAGEKRSAALNNELRNLKELNQQITQEAKNLTLALKGDSKTQGNWGEMQVEKILEKAGLLKGTHYRKEQSFANQEGRQQRLDYIIDLPDGKSLILDAKVSLTAYAKYTEAEEEEEQSILLKQHMQSIYGHIKTLGDKNYQELYQIPSPDYVLMFIANEPALTLALREDEELYEKALNQNLVLVSTSTLLATLRTISYIWKQDAQNRNAEEIARQAGNLYDKFVGFIEDLKKLGNQMDTSKKTYEAAMNKLVDGKGNLIRSTERIKKLGASASKQIGENFLNRADES